MVTHFRSWRIAIVGMLFGAVLTGWFMRSESQLQAEVRRNTPAEPEQHFKSGGRLSEAVLQEILVVLKRMDDRLARLESSVPTRGTNLQSAPATEKELTPPTDREVPEIKVRRGK